jgi:hypothetical protein
MTHPQCNVLTFQWDSKESLGGDGFLTPVYFNRQVLTRYLYDSRFTCEFASETYGTVHGDDFCISFGINKNGSVIAWQGDLQTGIPVRERFYWLVENKEPEGETESDFYDAQVNAKFTKPPAVVRALNSLSKFNAAFHQKFSIHLYYERSIEERIDETRRYNRLILNNIDDFKRFISEFNEIINENANNTELRKLLTKRGITFVSGSKGNKLLASIYESVLGDTENLIAPFFYLYDLRLWADHSISNERLNDVALKLRAPSYDYQRLMEALIETINESAEKLLACIEKPKVCTRAGQTRSDLPHQFKFNY